MSHPGLVYRVSSLPPLGSSDHIVLESCLKSFPRTVPLSTRLRQLWCYDEVDFEEVNHLLLGLDWSPVLAASTIDEAWDFWKESFFSVIHAKVPSKVIAHIRPKSPWITRDIAKLIRDKHKAWRLFKRSGTPEHTVTPSARFVTELHPSCELQNAGT